MVYDLQRRAFSMSERARRAFADAASPGGPGAPPRQALEFWCGQGGGGKLWIGARPAEFARPAGSGLLPLERSLVRHVLHLVAAERDLHARARRGRGGGAVRQIERERQRLARDLHTGVGQMLTAIRLQLEALTVQLVDPPAAARQALERISALVRDALDQVRALSHRLHPPEWQRLTLEGAVEQLWNLSGIPARFEASLRVEPLPADPGLELKTLVYRAAQEALSNIAQHARATRVEASLAARGGIVELRIADNGVGFNLADFLSAPPSVASGIGLRSIREQAAELGGKLDIETGANGTTLTLTAPFSPDRP
jgi:two-component system NarL family sensor kinase